MAEKVTKKEPKSREERVTGKPPADSPAALDKNSREYRVTHPEKKTEKKATEEKAKAEADAKAAEEKAKAEADAEADDGGTVETEIDGDSQ